MLHFQLVRLDASLCSRVAAAGGREALGVGLVGEGK